jgi:hypothetical protein
MNLPEDKRFYVYVYLDPSKPGHYCYGDVFFKYEPFYVGKGSGQRWADHLKQAAGIKKKTVNNHKINRIIKLQTKGTPPVVVRFASNLSSEQAGLVESVLIECIGRRDNNTGYLCNMTDGGDGCKELSKEARGRISQSLMGKNPWNKGKTGIYSDETRAKISNTLTGRKSIPLTEYQKDCISKAHKGKLVSEETRKKSSDSHKGKIPWNKGKKTGQIPWNKKIINEENPSVG